MIKIKIGFLHSIKMNLGNLFNAKMPRIHYKDWQYYPNNWLWYYYGQHTNREKLRGLIYNYRPYIQELADLNEYDLIAFSLNFDNYPSDFKKFVTSVINDLHKNFPFLHNKEVIILAGNEVYEKRKSAEKVIQTSWDTAQGVKNSVKPDLPICCWNQKISIEAERDAIKKMLNNSTIKQICKYVGFQSLGMDFHRMDEFIRYIRSKGFERIDTELMTNTNDYYTTKTAFDIDKELGIEKIFIGCPYISQELANYDENFKKYALSINDYKKDKYKLLSYIQQFKTKGKGIMIRDEYKLGDSGDKVIDWIQDQLYHRGFLAHPIDFGNFDEKTEQAVKDWQATQPKIAISGVITKYHISVLVEQSDNSTKIFRQLMIYAS